MTADAGSRYGTGGTSTNPAPSLPRADVRDPVRRPVPWPGPGKGTESLDGCEGWLCTGGAGCGFGGTMLWVGRTLPRTLVGWWTSSESGGGGGLRFGWTAGTDRPWTHWPGAGAVREMVVGPMIWVSSADFGCWG
ncbi:hypothetical protein GCM10029964_118080 [Kibdelosporangium lantanae]